MSQARATLVPEVVDLAQPADLFNLKVHVRCGCRAVRKLCIPTDQPMPERLRCPLGPPGGGGAVRCPKGHPCGIGISEIRDRALRELERGRGEHIRAGAVVIEC
jgi:hypothetical protein